MSATSMTDHQPMDDPRWEELRRPVPGWFRDARFGIFVHWGAYSVAAWAEPIAELGTVADEREWFTRNPYAEWYHNTIRIAGSAAQRHHRKAFGGAPYDCLLDLWRAEKFDAGALLDLVVDSGADYVVPTTKHHDGIALWDAPGTGSRNTVHRGPGRDIVADLSTAARERGVRLGLYYSGGLDWHVRPSAPHRSQQSVQDTDRPKDAGYARYAYAQVRDLVDRYEPDILWNDIDWPDAGKHFGDHGLGELFRYFYSRHPEGVVNDRWGRGVHQDFGTSEYQQFREVESHGEWEHCRGIGLSFGYNQVEGPEHCLDAPGIARHLVDVVSRGGRLLLNIGPRADGTIPDLQRTALLGMSRWMRTAKPLLTAARPSRLAVGTPSRGWARVVESGEDLVVFVDRLEGGTGPVDLTGTAGLRLHSLEPRWGTVVVRDDGSHQVHLSPGRPGPAVLRGERG